ncbi:MAG: MBL fold metallo-hydrolase, partial [Armatimonadota bacterium]
MRAPRVEIIVLRDNHAREGLRAGHGLALMIRTEAGSFLLDTGDSAQTWANADAMGIDPAEAQALVLSHGHYDHTRGLPALLRRLGELRVIAHPLVFEPRYHEGLQGELADIGPPMSREELEELRARFELSDQPVEVLEGAVTTGEVPRRSGLSPEAPHLMVERDGEVRRDDFRDDLSVIVETDGAPLLVTGCAHAGLVDIAARAEQVAGRYPGAIIGGTHLAREPEQRIAA